MILSVRNRFEVLISSLNIGYRWANYPPIEETLRNTIGV